MSYEVPALGESLQYGDTLYSSVHFISRSNFSFNHSFWYQRLNIKVFETIIQQDGLSYAVVMNNPKTYWYMTKYLLFPHMECPLGSGLGSTYHGHSKTQAYTDSFSICVSMITMTDERECIK